MEVTINVKSENPIETAAIKRHLQALADNVEKDNLKFLSELSLKPGINKKLKDNQGKIKFFL